MAKTQSLFSNSYMIFVITLTLSTWLHASNLSLDVTGSDLSKSVTSIYRSIDSQNYTSQTAQRPLGDITAKWELEIEEPNFVLINVGGISTPIQIKEKSVTAVSNHFGRVTYTQNEIRSTTRTPTLSADYRPPVNGYSFQFRPTLFISLCGFSLTGENDDTCNKWQRDIQLKLLNVDYQYKHFAVDWRSNSNNRSQVKDLSKLVSNFLRNKQYKWDVVLLGYSRGAIFAHDLSSRLLNIDKINNLHTFLLDPTTAPFLEDYYPKKLAQSNARGHFGSLFYDLRAGVSNFQASNLSIPVNDLVHPVSDKDIYGYTNYNRYDFYFNSSSHESFYTEWLASNFQRGLTDILANKVIGVYNYDGDLTADNGMDVVRIDIKKLYVDLDLNIGGGKVEGLAEVCINSLPSELPALCTTAKINISSQEIYASASIWIVSAQAIVNHDIVSVSIDSPLGASFSASIERGETNVNLKILNIDVLTKIDFSSISDLGASIEIGSIKIGFSLSNTINNAASIADELVSGVSSALVSTVRTVQSGLESISLPSITNVFKFKSWW